METIEKLFQALSVSPLYFFLKRVVTALDIFDTLPADVRVFLLQNDSLPYLMLSTEAFHDGVSSEELRELYKVLSALRKKKPVEINWRETACAWEQ